MKGTYIIAEVGSVHDGSIGLAKKLIEAAAECGVDAVKFQTHIAEAETLKSAPMPKWFKGEPRYDYFQRTGFSEKEWKELKKHAESKNVDFISSAFSEEAVELLEEVGTAMHKVPSGEVTNLPLLEKMAKTDKWILLSSGMSDWKELDEAVKTIKKHTKKIIILQCTTAYPAPPEKVGLNVMVEMRERYKIDVGFSDHSADNYTAFAAVVLGAHVVEKHFTLSKKMYGSDAKNAMEPQEMTELVQGIRTIEKAVLSKVDKNDTSDYKEEKEIFEKSVVSITDIEKGTKITREMLGIKKPGTGIPTKELSKVVGSKAKRDIAADTLIERKDLE